MILICTPPIVGTKQLLEPFTLEFAILMLQLQLSRKGGEALITCTHRGVKRLQLWDQPGIKHIYVHIDLQVWTCISSNSVKGLLRSIFFGSTQSLYHLFNGLFLLLHANHVELQVRNRLIRKQSACAAQNGTQRTYIMTLYRILMTYACNDHAVLSSDHLWGKLFSWDFHKILRQPLRSILQSPLLGGASEMVRIVFNHGAKTIGSIHALNYDKGFHAKNQSKYIPIIKGRDHACSQDSPRSVSSCSRRVSAFLWLDLSS